MTLVNRGTLARSNLLLLAGSSALCGWAGATLAQPAGAPAVAGAKARSATIEEVTVTARHRREKAQSVPIAITSLSAKQLSNTGITQIAQIGQLAPSLQVTETNPRNTSFNIRGIGNNVSLTSDGLESGVGVYVDGVLLGRPGAATFALPELQNVQVLRGPQGTLFGKNTTSGALDVHTMPPSFTFGEDAEASVGNYGYWQFKDDITGPVGKSVAIRLSVIGDQRDGTVYDTFNHTHLNDEDDKGLRGQLLWTPSSDFSLRVIADYEHQSENCCAGPNAGVFTTLENGTPLFGIAERGAYFGYKLPPVNPFAYQVDINTLTHFNMETGGVSAEANYNLAGLTLTSITAWRFWNWDPINDADGTALPVFNDASQLDRQKQFSQELRVTSPVGAAIDYTAGAYYFYQALPGQARTAYGPDAGPFLLTPSLPASLAAAVADNLTVAAHTAANTASYAGYGQATWHILPKLDLTGGLRYTYEDKTGSFDQYRYGGTPLEDLPAALQPVVAKVRNALGRSFYYDDHTHNGSVSWLSTLTYKFTPDLLGYVTYSRGNKSGGLNVSNLPPGINPVVKPERVDNYEIGFKSTLFGNRLVFDAAAYWVEDSDYQATVTALLSGATTTTYIANVPRVRSRGFEIDASTARFHGLALRFSGAYDDAEYESFPSGTCPPELVGSATKICNVTGKQVPGTSRWTMSLGGDYQHYLGEIAQDVFIGYLGADFSLRSSFNDTVDDSIYGKIPGYGVLDLRGGARTEDGRYDFFLWSRNATFTRYYQTLSASGSTGIISGILGDPRTYGATLRVHF